MRREMRISYLLRQLLSCHGPTAYGRGVTGCARTRAPARERRGALGPPQATEPGCGAEPHVSQLPRPDGVTGCARTRAPARERRGVLGPPQAAEPGCGAEPHVSQLPRRDGVTGCARTRAPARERRGVLGPPQATEPGVWGGAPR